jgi:hypothetical protein
MHCDGYYRGQTVLYRKQTPLTKKNCLRGAFDAAGNKSAANVTAARNNEPRVLISRRRAFAMRRRLSRPAIPRVRGSRPRHRPVISSPGGAPGGGLSGR